MAKPKNNSPQAKINRNNRKRGSQFEKSVADFLGMHVVPYSGSNARFGYGDIRDTPDKENSLWLGECKNFSEDKPRIIIKDEWMIDIKKEADHYGILPFVAIMRSGTPFKFVVLHDHVFDLINEVHKILFGEIPTGEIHVHSNDKRIRNIYVNDDSIADKFGYATLYKLFGGNDTIEWLKITQTNHDKPFYITTIKNFRWYLNILGTSIKNLHQAKKGQVVSMSIEIKE